MYICVQYALTNKGSTREMWPSTTLVDAKGGESPRMDADAYAPADWRPDPGEGPADMPRFPEKSTAKRFDCFQIDKSVAGGPLKLQASVDSWGSHPGWALSVPLP